ncbi:MAG TPA: DUF362 domain-containing protein [Clostridia bacterium]|nr:DUF362 domain-containing protein [Clostridia bacterium]
MPKVVKTKVEKDLKNSVSGLLGELGGFKKFIKTGEVVFLKPNFNTADPFPASTDLEFLKAVVELVYEAGAKLVMIGESSTVSLNTRKIMEEKGVFALQESETPPRVYIFEEGKWLKKPIPNSQYLKSVSLPEILSRVDKLILLPCLKTHKQAQFTGSLKLSIGLVRPRERVPIHLRDLQEKIAELNKVIQPDLIIMDARKCFINQGPSHGEVREPGLVLASTDRVAIDVEGIRIIQGYQGNSLNELEPFELPQIKKAIEFGIGKV